MTLRRAHGRATPPSGKIIGCRNYSAPSRVTKAMTRRFTMVEKSLNDLFLAQLKDIYFAEKKIYRTLPKMAKATKVPELEQAFTAHREETQGHIERLEQVFEMI